MGVFPLAICLSRCWLLLASMIAEPSSLGFYQLLSRKLAGFQCQIETVEASGLKDKPLLGFPTLVGFSCCHCVISLT